MRILYIYVLYMHMYTYFYGSLFVTGNRKYFSDY